MAYYYHPSGAGQQPQQQQHHYHQQGNGVPFQAFTPSYPYTNQQPPLLMDPHQTAMVPYQNTMQTYSHSRHRAALPGPHAERRRRRSLRVITGNNDFHTPTLQPLYKPMSFVDPRTQIQPRKPKFINGRMPVELKRLLPPPAKTMPLGNQHTTGHPEYQLITKVPGFGNMSRGVFKVQHRSAGQVMVLKRVAMGTRRSKAEITALWQLRLATVHPNINFIIDYFVDERLQCYSLLLNDCDKGTLETMIQGYQVAGRKTPAPILYHTFLSLARALSFTHFGVVDPAKSEVPVSTPWNSICHLDIKPANIFVKTSDATGTKLPRIVLGDFGCAVSDWDIHSEKENAFAQSHGTPGWFPPENIGSTQARLQGAEICYGLPTDIWQIGGVVQVMAKQCSRPDQVASTTDAPCGEGYDVELQRAVQACMTAKFRNRPGAIQIVIKLTEVMREKGYETYH